jgi:hypothetical protein
MGNVFGRIVTGISVQKAMDNTVRLWAADYLAEVASQEGRQALPNFRSYVGQLDPALFQPEQLPSCVIVAPGLAEKPRRHATTYTAKWAVGVVCIVSGQTESNTFDLLQLYTAAVRAIVLQHPSLGGFASGIEWVTERYDNLGNDDLRTLGSGINQFNVEVEGVTDIRLGPSEPSEPSADNTIGPVDWPTAAIVTTRVEEMR